MPDARDPDEVIDLTSPRGPDRETLQLEPESPFERLSDHERKRLIVRVLCELVAYGELDPADESLSA